MSPTLLDMSTLGCRMAVGIYSIAVLMIPVSNYLWQCYFTLQAQTGQETATVEWPLPVEWQYTSSDLEVEHRSLT